jgi:hypothetical protein
MVPVDQVRQFGFRIDWNPVRIQASGQNRGVRAAVDVGNLRRREGDYFI